MVLSELYMHQNYIKPKDGKLLFIAVLLMLLPLSLPLGNIGDKPIDLTYSDLLLVLHLYIFYV